MLPRQTREKHLAGTRRANSRYVRSIAFSPDSQTLISGGWDKTLRAWSVNAGKESRRLESLHGHINATAISPDGKLVAWAGEDSVVRLSPIGFGEPVTELRGHRLFISSLTFSTSGRLLASAGADAIVRIWDVATGRMLKSLTGHISFIAASLFLGTTSIWRLPETITMSGYGALATERSLRCLPATRDMFRRCASWMNLHSWRPPATIRPFEFGDGNYGRRFKS